MEMIKIDQLPVEILMEIFKYLSSYNDVSLVNKLFYDVACSVNDSNVLVSFYQIFLKNGNHRAVLNSIQKTQRKISNLFISLGVSNLIYNDGSTQLRKSAIPDVIKIVRKFSATIKYFDLQHCKLEMYDFLQILSLLPNAENLEFSFLSKKEQSLPMQFGDECLSLHRVKTLLLHHCCQEFLVVFNRLPADVLKKLTIVHWNLNLNLLAGLFEQQSKITELFLLDKGHKWNSQGTLSNHILDHLKLESLELFQYGEYNSTNTTILSKQTELTSLSLRDGEADSSVLNVITNQLTKLKVLEIKVSSAMIVPFKKIVNLKNLKDLTVRSCSLKLIETLATLDNSPITTLIMKEIVTGTIDNDEFPPMPINVIGSLANSLPNLKELEFDYYCECEAIIAIMQKFNFIDVLEMKFDYDIDANRLTQAIDVDLCFNPILTELRITKKFLFAELFLTKIIAIYPNLKKLFVCSSTSITTTQLKIILNGFKKMDSLALYVDRGNLTTEHLECLKDHKNNLKCITLSGFDFDKFPVEQEKKFSSIFDIIRYKYGTLYMGYKTIVKLT